MDNSLSTMEEIRKLTECVIAAKLLLVNEIVKKFEESPVSNELRLVQVQLKTEQNHLVPDNVSVNYSIDQNDQTLENQQQIASKEPVNNGASKEPVNNAPVDEKQQIIEQFQSDGNLDFRSQQVIVDDVNQCLAGKNLKILYDDAHSTWLCFHYPINKIRNRNILMFSPVDVFASGWSKFPIAQQNLIKELNAWLPNFKDPLAHLGQKPCRPSEQPATQFLYVLVFAFSCACNFTELFSNPCGDKPIGSVRKIIGDALSNGLGNEMNLQRIISEILK